MSRSFGSILALALLPSGAFATTWTVAPSGGDFTTIQAAIDASAPGDVLRIMPGSYGAFSLTKELAILGVPSSTSPEPSVSGTSSVTSTPARIAGLKLTRLEIVNCNGLVLLDDLQIGSLGCDASLVVRNSSNVQLARSSVHGKNGDFYCEGAGILVEDGVMTITTSSIVGGTGWGDDFFGYSGRPAVLARGASRLLLAGTDCYGGDGGTPQILFGGQGGWGAPALELDVTASPVEPHAVVRGSVDTQIHGGHAGQGIAGQDAYYVVGGDGGTLTFSGAAHWPTVLTSAAVDVIQPAPEEPYSSFVGNDVPSAFKRLSLFGPFGSPTLLLVSIGSSHFAVPGVLGPVHLDPAAIVATVPLTLTGQDLSVNLNFTLPPSLVGLENFLLTAQAFSGGVTPSGAWFAQNPTFLLLRN